MRTRCWAGSQGNPGFPGLPNPPLPCPGLGSPVCAPVFAGVIARAQPGGVWGSLPRAGAVAEPPLGTLARSLFSLQKQAKQKDFQTCLGRDRMPNGLAPSFSLSCYLSRPVVWGESARGAHPHQRQPAGGAGLAQLVCPVE